MITSPHDYRLSPVKQFMRYWLPVVVWCTAIFVQSGIVSPESLPNWPHSDKLLHLGAYGLMAILVVRALNAHERWAGRILPLWTLAVAATVLYGLSDEWHQSFVSQRTADAVDLLADGIGAVAGAGLYLQFLIRPSKNRSCD